MLIEIGKRARRAARVLANSTTEEKNAALLAYAAAIEENALYIIEKNAIDVAQGRASGMSEALLDRLSLDEKRIKDIADSVRQVEKLPDPVGRVLSDTLRPNGLRIVKTSVPLGVLAVIYEARPNVTPDSAALCLKSGNAVILRGGSEAINSNKAIAAVLCAALESAGLPADCLQLIEDTSRETATELMRLNGYVDALIPRGGAGLIQAVLKNASVPVIETGAGTCHIYVDKSADPDMAAEIIYNAKTSRPSVCNACECMLIHKDIAERALPKIAARLKNVEIRGDAGVRALVPEAVCAAPEDWGREYNDYIIAAKTVDGIDEAIEHIFAYGTGHSEAIITDCAETAEYFMNNVDAAAVYHNASTRFTDGGEFGLGAEIGISTQKLHARGPLGLAELTSIKYKVYGNGQTR